MRGLNWHDIRILVAFAAMMSGALGFSASRVLLAAGPVPKFHEVVDHGSQVLLLESPAGRYAFFKANDQTYKLRLDSY